MDANPTTARRRPRLRARAVAAVGLTAAALGAAHTAPPRPPAATLRPARPADDAGATVVARGATPTPTFGAFQPNRPAAAPGAPGWLSGPSPTPPPSAIVQAAAREAPPPLPSLAPPAAAAKPVTPRPSYLGRKWGEVKEFFGGPDPMPVPPVTATAPRTFAPPPAPTRYAPVAQMVAPAPVPATGAVYAGPPAYRWYGWGSTTPGANPYAPAGHSPAGSATWFAESGATPGAFPVPAMGAPRAEPGRESPAYARRGGPLPDDLGVRPVANRAFLPPPAAPAPKPERVIAPLPVFAPVPAAAPPAFVPPSAPTVTVPPRVVTPTAMDAGPLVPIARSSPAGGVIPASHTVAELPPPVMPPPTLVPAAAPPAPLTWQTSAPPADVHFGPPPVIATTAVAPAPTPIPAPPPDRDEARHAAPPWVPRGQQPKADDAPPLDAAVRDAAAGRASAAAVQHTGPRSLVVRFVAPTAADAQAAAAAVSRLPALKEYEVKFEATIGGTR